MPSVYTAALVNSTLAYLAASTLYVNASASELATAAAVIRRDLSCSGTSRRLPTAMRGGASAMTGADFWQRRGWGFWYAHCAGNYNRMSLQILCQFEAKWWCVSTAAVMHVKSCGGVFCRSKGRLQPAGPDRR